MHDASVRAQYKAILVHETEGATVHDLCTGAANSVSHVQLC